MKNFKEWDNEQPVAGVYFGVPFTGHLIEDGALSCRRGPGGVFIFEIQLDAPMTVYGWKHDRITIWDNDDNELRKI